MGMVCKMFSVAMSVLLFAVEEGTASPASPTGKQQNISEQELFKELREYKQELAAYKLGEELRAMKKEIELEMAQESGVSEAKAARKSEVEAETLKAVPALNLAATTATPMNLHAQVEQARQDAEKRIEELKAQLSAMQQKNSNLETELVAKATKSVPVSDKGVFNEISKSKIAAEKDDDVMLILEQSRNKNSIKIPHRPLRLTTDSQGFHSMKATSDIKSSDIFMSLALDDIMVSVRPHEDIKNIFWNCTMGDTCKLLWRGPNTPFATMWMTLNLLYEHSLEEESRFYSYIQTLPTSFSTPKHWSNEELDELAGTSIYKENVEQQRLFYSHWYHQLWPALLKEHPGIFKPRKSYFTEEKFKWAFEIVETRAFALEIDGYNAKILAPLLDMVNHAVKDDGQSTGSWDYNDGRMVLIAKRPYQVGEEVTITYGTFDNAHLLETYGFTVPNNPVMENPRTKMPQGKSALVKELSLFKTTASQDEKLLANHPSMSHNLRNALTVRMGERAALMGTSKTFVINDKPSLWKPVTEVLPRNEELISDIIQLRKANPGAFTYIM